MISIVMPTYNKGVYIAETIDSIMRQKYKDWELVIIDDGSTDITEKVCNYYAKKDSRIKYYKRKENKGISYSRNEGVSYSTGDYIAVCDSDDLMNPVRLQKQLKTLLKHNVDFVYSSYICSDSHGKPINGGFVVPPDKLTKELVLDGYTAPHVTILAKRECFLKNPYLDKYEVNDDLYLVLKWLDAKYTYKTTGKEPMMIVRYNDTSVSVRRDKEVKKITEELRKIYE